MPRPLDGDCYRLLASPVDTEDGVLEAAADGLVALDRAQTCWFEAYLMDLR